MHSIWLDATEYLFTFYVGLVLGVIYLKTRSLICPIAVHTVVNFTLFQMIPFYWS
jgi:membrane protease YdiL (CAAX protease family)